MGKFRLSHIQFIKAFTIYKIKKFAKINKVKIKIQIFLFITSSKPTKFFKTVIVTKLSN